MKKSKQILSVFLAMLMIALSVPVAFAEVDTSVAAPYWGDVNGDHKADFSDILQLNKIRLGKIQGTPEQLCFGDVNLNGEIQGVYNEDEGITDNNIFDDILQINKFRLGKISSLPAYSLAKITFNPPTKTVYKPGDDLNTDGMSVVVENKNNSKVKYTLTENISVAGYKPNKIGTQQLTATFRGLTFSFSVKVNIYNLKEETYGFHNYDECTHAACNGGGHCFGMAITSSGYYREKMAVSKLGINSSDKLYTVPYGETVKEPICYYQRNQDLMLMANCAAVYTDAYGYQDYCYDWDTTIAFLKDHKSDNSGRYVLVVLDEDSDAGHAVNFLYYKVVAGEDRIYTYDNNFQTVETYFYRDSNGEIIQKPYATIENIYEDGFILVDVEKYLEAAKALTVSKCIYAPEGEIKVEGVEPSKMLCGVGEKARYIYRLPASSKEVNIIPLHDNASFVYMNTTKNFGKIGGQTFGKLKLSTINSDTGSGNESFVIYNAPNDVSQPSDSTQPTQPTQPQQLSGGCAYCGGSHTGIFGWLIGLIHSILAMFGLHK